MGSTAHGHGGGPGRPSEVPNSPNTEDLPMSHDSQHHDDAPSGGPMEQGSPEAARAANLLVGITVAVLLIALAVVVALA